MSIFSENIRVLRAKKGLSQQKLADELTITRARLSKYEEGKSEPPLEVLRKISSYYHVSIDVLISVDLTKTAIETLMKLGDNRILLPVAVGKEGKEFIEIIPHKAKAGYLMGYSDPEYIEGLQQFHLPFLRKGKYRAFPIEGDSMPPHNDSSFIIGRYVENAMDVKEGKTYVFLDKAEGIVYKRVSKKTKGEFLLTSDNPFYTSFKVKMDNVIEIWEYACSLSTKEAEPDDLSIITIKEMLMQIRKDITGIKTR